MKSKLLKIVGGMLAVVLLLVGVLLVRSLTASSKQVDVEPTTYAAADGASERLAASVRIRTVSNEDRSKMDMEAFGQFNEFLVTSYPKANAVMERELVAPCSVIYTWRGRNADLAPVLLANHTDVVPVEEDQLSEWEHGPFSGKIVDGHIWGRGTLDDKVGVLGLLEGAEVLAGKGHQPNRTIVFAFGCDEEVGGALGAEKMAKMFAERGMTFDFAFDEGLAIVDGYVPGLDQPAALVGLVEKGFATFTLTAVQEGGHSSMPPKESAIGILSQAVARLEKNRMPTSLNPASEQMFETLGPHMNFGLKLVMTNLWLLEPVLVSVLEGQPSTNASVRTTTAVTMMNAGVQDNVLAKKAVAKVNFRLAPGDSIDDVYNHIIKTVDDERVNVEKPKQDGGFGNPASKISSADTQGFGMIRDSIRAAFGNEVIVAPGSTTGGTDVRHYEDVSEDQYRFAPVYLQKSSDDTSRIHGTNERISVENWNDAIAFYAELISKL